MLKNSKCQPQTSIFFLQKQKDENLSIFVLRLVTFCHFKTKEKRDKI